MKNGIYIVDIYTEDGKQMCYIATQNSSGCKYEVKNSEDVGKLITDYLESYDDITSDKTVDKVNLKQYSHKICDVFENLLEKHNIDIPDDDRTGDEEEAHLYGVTYSNLEDEVKEILVEIAEKIKREGIELEVDSY